MKYFIDVYVYNSFHNYKSFFFSRNYDEELVSYEILRSGLEDLRIIVTNQWVRIITSSGGHNLTTVIECQLR